MQRVVGVAWAVVMACDVRAGLQGGAKEMVQAMVWRGVGAGGPVSAAERVGVLDGVRAKGA